MLPYENNHCYHAYHLFTIFHKKAKKIIIELKKRQIETRIIYPYPIHKMKAFKKYKFNNKKLKNSDFLSKNILCLPLFPELKSKEVITICNKIKTILKDTI